MFPLEIGNRWVYETGDGGQSFTITVGVPAIVGGKIYSSVRGYGYGNPLTKTLLVRQGDDGALYTVDQDTEQDVLLTLFTHIQGGWFDSRLGPCEEQGQAAEQRKPWSFGSGSQAAAVAIHYRGFSCADAGLEEELYVENIGLVRRRFHSFAGPVEFNLVYARVGNLVYRNAVSGTLSLELDRSHLVRTPGQPLPDVRVKLRYSTEPPGPGTLRFRSGQHYDFILADSTGQEVWRWSDGGAFIQAIEELPYAGFVIFGATLPADLFPDGTYTLYGVLNTDSERQPTVSVPFVISSPEPEQEDSAAPEGR